MLLLGLGWGLTTGFGSTHAVEKLSFSMFPSILTFDFDLILGSFLSSGLGASKDRFVGPSVEKILKSLNEQNYVEFNSD